ncbi:recombinational DNA repair protein RecR [Pedobacter sp. UYP24]
MSEIEKYPVLDYIVNTLKNALTDAKLEIKARNEYIIKDGNDEILLRQEPTNEGNAATILITDKRHIIFSEDLLETLQYIHQDIVGNPELMKALENATIIINDLDIETELVFQAIKDQLDQLSNSYEFIQSVENKITKIGAGFKFGKHIFRLNINNEPKEISIETRFTPTFDPAIQKTIAADIQKVQAAVNKMFKED